MPNLRANGAKNRRGVADRREGQPTSTATESGATMDPRAHGDPEVIIPRGIQSPGYLIPGATNPRGYQTVSQTLSLNFSGNG